MARSKVTGQILLLLVVSCGGAIFRMAAGQKDGSGDEAPRARADESGMPQAQYPCSRPEDFGFCNTELAIADRVEDLVGRLSTREKVMQLVNSAASVPRLGLPPYQWWQEGLHGVARSPGVSFDGRVKGATSFPQPILTASSFDKKLFNRIGQVTSTEARAMHNMRQSGLTFWAPNINIFRDPRWGRGQETPGEDPLLTSVYASHFVRGMQEDSDYREARTGSLGRNGPTAGPAHLKVSACCKHFAAYDIDQWYAVDRYDFDAKVSAQDLLDTYNAPFKSCVEQGRASSLMCSYNRLNGVPTCADRNLLTKQARGDWGFDGYIVSDCDALQVMYANSKYAKTPDYAVAYSLQAGMDMNCGDTMSNFTNDAIASGLVNVSSVDAALRNSYKVLFRLGYFDGNPRAHKYGELDENDVCTEEHRSVALQAALEGIVLLKNENNALPLSKQNVQKLAVIGPNANDSEFTMLGNYAGAPCLYMTPLASLTAYVRDTTFCSGCDSTACEGNGIRTERFEFREAAEAASNADAVVVVVGLGQEQEREAFDRTSLLLPGKQKELIEAVAEAAKGPVVLVVLAGGPVDVGFAKNHPKIDSILWAGYPGQAGGQAIAQIVFGDYNPGGKLAMTWYPEEYTKWPMTDMNLRPDDERGFPGRTYRFYKGETVYRFGHGLSYSNFSRSFKSAPARAVLPSPLAQNCFHKQWASEDECSASQSHKCEEASIELTISVQNMGSLQGSDIVLLFYTSPTSGQNGAPLQQLVAFQRVEALQPKQEMQIEFMVNPCSDLSSATLEGTWSHVLQGVHTFFLDGGVEHEIEFVHQ